MKNEKQALQINGFLVFLVLVGLGFLAWSLLAVGPNFLSIVCGVLVFFGLSGFVVLPPNEAAVVTFLGTYIGTLSTSGFWWTVPFTQKIRVSLKIHNFDSARLKVNDAHGNPIEIAAVIVWRVIDTAKAIFDVENYGKFIGISTETAVRSLAAHFPYDSHDDRGPSLRGSPDEVAQKLKMELAKALEVAGIEVLETRLSHLAYAPEIAHAMLRRQQAQAVIAARQQIVEGAVGMVEMALNHLQERRIIVLNEERKATMVNNLLVVLASDQDVQPVVNSGLISTSET